MKNIKKKTFILCLFLMMFPIVAYADGCEGLLTKEAADFVNEIIGYVRIGVPILLVILCIADFVGVVTSQDEAAMKKVGSKVIKRFIAAAAVFFVPLIIGVVLGIPAIKNSLNLVDDPLCEDGDYQSEEELREETEKNRVKLNKTNMYLFEGESGTLSVISSNKDVTWSSSDEKVATVDKKGKVTAKKKGTAKITASAGNNKANCIVTVRVKGETNNGNGGGGNGTPVTGKYANYDKLKVSQSTLNGYSNDMIDNLAAFMTHEGGGIAKCGFRAQLFTGAIYMNNLYTTIYKGFPNYVTKPEQITKSKMCELFSCRNPQAYTSRYCSYTLDTDHLNDTQKKQARVAAQLVLSGKFTIPKNVTGQGLVQDWGSAAKLWGTCQTCNGGFQQYGISVYMNSGSPYNTDLYGTSIDTSFDFYQTYADYLYEKYVTKGEKVW